MLKNQFWDVTFCILFLIPKEYKLLYPYYKITYHGHSDELLFLFLPEADKLP